MSCRRVAHLIASGVEPANVWLLSFTRTAVHEVRTRIKELAKSVPSAVSVRIFTLDSQAWQLVNGFADDRSDVFGGYSQTIDAAVALLREPPEQAREYFEAVEHLIVDEAQDLVGNRADLVELRRQVLEVNAQEILTKDRVTLRVNLSAEFRVVDPVLGEVRIVAEV